MARAAALLLLLGLLAGCVEPEADDDPSPSLTASGAPTASSAPAPADVCGPRPDRERQGEDWSKETLVLHVTSPEAFAVDIPVPVSPGGSTLSQWAANVSATGGVRVTTAILANGSALRVTGAGDAVVVACTIQDQSQRGNGCCAEQFLDRSWTLERGDDRVAIHVGTGTVALVLTYSALSNWCGADGRYEGEALRPGWRSLAGGDGAWCA